MDINKHMRIVSSFRIVLFCFVLFFACACQQVAADYPIFGFEKSSFSRYRSFQEAQSCALFAASFLSNETKGDANARQIASGKCVSVPLTKGEELLRDTLYYIFNFADDSGFAIIDANRAAPFLICVTEKGTYDESPTGILGFDVFMDSVRSQIVSRYVEPEYPVEPDSTIFYYYEDEYDGDYVLPIVKTAWGQDGIYGQYCPNGIAGCVSTAIGQVITALHFPMSITLSVGMGTDFSLGQSIVMPWSGMESHVKAHSSSGYWTCSSYHNYIGALLRDIGQRVVMHYYQSSSGAGFNMIPGCLADYGFVCSPVASANISDIKSSLDNGHPVIMSGNLTSFSGGHAWVADGYKDCSVYRNHYAQSPSQQEPTLLFRELIGEVQALHINWGWDGVCNGYFNFNTYNTAYAQSYDYSDGISYNFLFDILAITDIHPQL